MAARQIIAYIILLRTNGAIVREVAEQNVLLRIFWIDVAFLTSGSFHTAGSEVGILDNFTGGLETLRLPFLVLFKSTSFPMRLGDDRYAGRAFECAIEL